MKYLLSLLLIVLLVSCSSPAGHAVKSIGSQVKKCCASFCIDKNDSKMMNTNCPETEAGSASMIPASVFEIGGRLATW